jgi:hypothetical protein
MVLYMYRVPKMHGRFVLEGLSTALPRNSVPASGTLGVKTQSQESYTDTPQQTTTTTVETSGSPRRTTPRSYHGGTWVTRLGKRGVRPANRNSVGRGLAWAVTFALRLCSMQNAVMLRLSSPGDRKISHAHAASGVLSTVEGQRTNERNGLPLPVETGSVVDDARSRAGRLDSSRLEGGWG